MYLICFADLGEARITTMISRMKRLMKFEIYSATVSLVCFVIAGVLRYLEK